MPRITFALGFSKPSSRARIILPIYTTVPIVLNNLPRLAPPFCAIA